LVISSWLFALKKLPLAYGGASGSEESRPRGSIFSGTGGVPPLPDAEISSYPLKTLRHQNPSIFFCQYFLLQLLTDPAAKNLLFL
jgi:hypothetical protein